jgi:hypothetical protein
MKNHAPGLVLDTAQDASPQVTTMIGKIAKDNLRYRILHVAARIVKVQRRRYLRIPPSWPWARDITEAFTRILALPPP